MRKPHKDSVDGLIKQKGRPSILTKNLNEECVHIKELEKRISRKQQENSDRKNNSS